MKELAQSGTDAPGEFSTMLISRSLSRPLWWSNSSFGAVDEIVAVSVSKSQKHYSH